MSPQIHSLWNKMKGSYFCKRRTLQNKVLSFIYFFTKVFLEVFVVAIWVFSLKWTHAFYKKVTYSLIRLRHGIFRYNFFFSQIQAIFFNIQRTIILSVWLMDTITYLFRQVTQMKLQQNLIKFDVDSLITYFLGEKMLTCD